MTRRLYLSFLLVCLTFGPAYASDPAAVRIGMVKSLFTDVSPGLIQLITREFGTLVYQVTGVRGEMVDGGDPMELARKLNDGSVHLAVFHGVEFGWVREQFPELQPLMVSINKYRTMRANLVVRNDSTAAGLKDLKDKDLAMPMFTRLHCRLFLDRACQNCGSADSASFFKNVQRTLSIEGALDDVVAGRAQAALVDVLAMETYQEVKPSCCNRLKILHQSESFPTGVLVYKRGALSDATLNQFRTGMAGAHRHETGKEMMRIFKITSFDPIPSDFEKTVSDIVKAYPAPK